MISLGQPYDIDGIGNIWRHYDDLKRCVVTQRVMKNWIGDHWIHYIPQWPTVRVESMISISTDLHFAKVDIDGL